MSTPSGGFREVREHAIGHPMVSLFRYASRYQGRLMIAIAASIVYRAAVLLPALTIAETIDRVIQAPGQPGELARLGIVTREVIPAEATDQRISLLMALMAIALGAYFAQAVFRWVSRYYFQSTAQLIQHDLRSDSYAHMQRLSMSFFDGHETGGMMAILNDDINRLEEFFNTEIRQIVRAIVMFTFVGTYLYYNAPSLAPLILIPLALIAVLTYRFISWIEPKYKRIRELVAELNTRLSNNLGGIEVIKTLDRYDIETDRVGDHSAAYRDENVEAIRLRTGFFASLRVVMGLMFAAILFWGGMAVIDGTMTAGTFVVFFMYLRELDGPMRRIGQTANRYQKAKSSAERVFGLLGYDPEITDIEHGYTPDAIQGHVEFDSVSFAYKSSNEGILSDIALEIPAGMTVGLAGSSGSGKSTLVKLIPRLYDVEAGRVLVDDVDVREYDLRTLRDAIGVVEQDPYMFSGTARENLVYGDHDLFREYLDAGSLSTASQQFVESAARRAGAHDFISDLPDGYDTQIGERGVKLSGGQRQRLSIARILLNDPSIIIFDEATSSVDTETEQIIQENLAALTVDRTAFIIAHRLSTIQAADRIVVLEAGRIVESGTHEALLENDGDYARLWKAQTDETLSAD